MPFTRNRKNSILPIVRLKETSICGCVPVFVCVLFKTGDVLFWGWQCQDLGVTGASPTCRTCFLKWEGHTNTPTDSLHLTHVMYMAIIFLLLFILCVITLCGAYAVLLYSEHHVINKGRWMDLCWSVSWTALKQSSAQFCPRAWWISESAVERAGKAYSKWWRLSWWKHWWKLVPCQI